MITSLSIKNYALIEDIHVRFSDGLTIITGETGAGKSILLGALGLVVGKRADLKVARNPAIKCVIEAEFNIANYNLASLFSKNDLDYETHTIVRRELLPSGKSRAFVNDTPVTLQQMQLLGTQLIDIHSQNETQTLSTESYQMHMIDALANNQELCDAYANSLAHHRRLEEELAELLDEKEQSEKELDYNSFLHHELVELGLKNVEQDELETSYEKLNNAEDIQAVLGKVHELFNSELSGSIMQLTEARGELSSIQEYADEYKELWERLHSTVIELEDISEALQIASQNIAANPKKLVEVNGVLQALYKLQQKHTVSTVPELMRIEEELAEKLDASSSIDVRISGLEASLVSAKEQLLSVAKRLTNTRSQAIPELKLKLESLLTGLGLPHAQFQFNLIETVEFRKYGNTKLELLFTANKGMAFGPLRKVASGGEMSRIMLAVKAVLTNYKKLPTLIFDEIDTGVSGEIALKMAEIMNGMSKEMQLLSITHLPQIAAKGDHHKKVYKTDDTVVASTLIKDLNPDDRIIEIAQMIGGSTLSESAIAHAKQLLN